MPDHRYRYGLFAVVGFASGIPDEDRQYLAAHPLATERWRAFIPGEVVPELPGATDTYVFEVRDFDGNRLHVWHRMFLRRKEHSW
jgi:hypothetical protein